MRFIQKHNGNFFIKLTLESGFHLLSVFRLVFVSLGRLWSIKLKSKFPKRMAANELIYDYDTAGFNAFLLIKGSGDF